MASRLPARALSGCRMQLLQRCKTTCCWAGGLGRVPCMGPSPLIAAAQEAKRGWQLSSCVSVAASRSVAASASPAAAAPASETGGSALTLTTQDEDTIAAIVTGAAQGSVAIIRISGTDAIQVANRVFRPGGKFKFDWQPESHRVYYGTAVNADEQVVDEVLLMSMLSPRSYTCEDVIELHCHGGGVCAQRVLQACVEAGARPARAGEFTLRAFLNGRLDLSQAENVLQLLQARTHAAADSALAGLRDGVGKAVAEMREECMQILGELEARLDFDEDMPSMEDGRLQRQIEALQARIEAALRTARQSTLLRQGLQVAIVGRPNVGKSSLLNAWTRTNRAIVTEIAGTTRDVLEAGLTVGGVPITLLDTAGIRDSSDVVEQLGVQRSQDAAASADIVIMVIDAQAGWTSEDAVIFKALWGDGPNTRSCSVKGLSLLVANKQDLVAAAAARVGAEASPQAHEDGAASTSAMHVPSEVEAAGRVEAAGARGGSGAGSIAAEAASASGSSGNGNGGGGGGGAGQRLLLPLLCRETFQHVVFTSATSREGMEGLDRAILALAGAPQLASGGVSWAVNERQADALVRAHEALMRVNDSVVQQLPIDFWTIDMRAAIIALGEVDGDDVTEQVLDNIFSRFCIGK